MKLPGKYFRKPQHESKPLVFKKGYLNVLNSFTQLYQIILLSAFHLSLTDQINKDCVQVNMHSPLRKKHNRFKSSLHYWKRKYFSFLFLQKYLWLGKTFLCDIYGKIQYSIFEAKRCSSYLAYMLYSSDTNISHTSCMTQQAEDKTSIQGTEHLFLTLT